jgi:hypothetical protein
MTLGMTINTNLENNMTALTNLGIVMMPVIIMGLALILKGEF